MTRTPWMAALAVLAGLALAAPASAAPVTKTFRSGPVKVGPYEVTAAELRLDVPTPAVNGYLTEMQTDIVDADGGQVPISRLMLHHIVFLNLGEKIGEKRDGTCNRFTGLDSKTTLPGVGERFGGAGEERLRMRLPPGYGYPIKAKDRWAMTYMLMNHRNKSDEAYIQYRVTYDTAPKKPVKPILAGHQELPLGSRVRHPRREEARARPPGARRRGPCRRPGASSPAAGTCTAAPRA